MLAKMPCTGTIAGSMRKYGFITAIVPCIYYSGSMVLIGGTLLEMAMSSQEKGVSISLSI